MTWQKAGDIARDIMLGYGDWTKWKKEQAQQYIDDVSSDLDVFDCCNGHGGCALWQGGPCANEVQVYFELPMEEA